jgi:hypothetical protein
VNLFAAQADHPRDVSATPNDFLSNRKICLADWPLPVRFRAIGEGT